MFDKDVVEKNYADQKKLQEVLGRYAKKKEIDQAFVDLDIKPTYWVYHPTMRTDVRGEYDLQSDPRIIEGRLDELDSQNPRIQAVSPEVQEMKISLAPTMNVDMDELIYIPLKNEEYVENKYSKRISQIIKSGLFFPTYLVGPTGTGKTETVEYVCSVLNREMVRVNFTEETSEHHLIGSMRMVDGTTVWEDGPVLTAMKRGAVLLLDEIDFGSAKVLVLQSILEGKAFINKKTGAVVRPAPGFQIFATANTKGTISGRQAKYVGARAQNEAFMDRFESTIEFEYMSKEEEYKIILTYFKFLFKRDPNEDEDIVLRTMTTWAANIRENYLNNLVQEVISTRRLKSFIKGIYITRNVKASLTDIVSRYNVDVQKAYMSYFTALVKEDDHLKISED